MSTSVAWESGLTCDGCSTEFTLGDEFVYSYGRKLHPRCARSDADARREAAEEDDTMAVARRLLDSGARIVLTRRQLRQLAAFFSQAGGEPVRKPDTGRQQWYGRLPGWSAARVRAGLPAAEVAGMWLDFLEAGRMPPLRQVDLAVIIEAIGDSYLPVTTPHA